MTTRTQAHKTGITTSALIAAGIAASVATHAHAEIITFDLSGTVTHAESFDASSGVWSQVQTGDTWSLSFALDTDTAIASGIPDLVMSYDFLDMDYTLQIGGAQVQETGQAISISVQGPGGFQESISLAMQGDTHLGIPITWIGGGVSTPDLALPTADWFNSVSTSMANPISFTTNGFSTPNGHVGDLAMLHADSIVITPTPASMAPLALAGMISVRRQRR